MPPFDIAVDSKKVGAAIDAAPKKTGLALLRALKRGTKAAGTQANRIVSKDMKLKVGDVRTRIKLKAPTGQTLTGELRASLKRIRLIKFGARATKRGVTYRGKGGRKRHPQAFIAPIKTGSGVFERKAAKRLPIRQLYGPSVGRVFNIHAREIMKHGEQVVIAEMDRQIDRMLGTKP